ncbi:protein kinase [Asanoa ishikariensis]|uniref:non-specific serine/threonine protein kinase n=1 Tax=Asanoa ishikariensis TaxID=137265 RepID=A0A1H3UW83_9ACTN|nr:BREX system serine/threonine kinase PglW [Asanoa ishikariensis]GIF65230.1 protein kinase [Asanoa ishikariensis]SDZ66700.1 serine/threonine protein kinase [Asanoa ishikariensis]
MREDSPRWEQINPSSFTWERDGLRDLASYLPDTDPFHVWANVEFVATDGSINEVDALVLTPNGLWIVELKHWQGEIRGDGFQWVRRVPGGRLTPEDNPYVLTNRKAKRLASLIRGYARRDGRRAEAPFVGAAVFLHARDMRASLDPVGAQHVYGRDDTESGLPSLKELLLAQPRSAAQRVDESRGREIVELVRGTRLRPSVADRKVGQLLLHPRPFAEGLGWQDFLAGHTMNSDIVRRVRFYLTSRADEEDVPAIRKAAEREFRLLQSIQHTGIAQAHDLVDHGWGPAVVFHHEPGWVRLDQWLAARGDRLTVAQRLLVVQELVEIMAYAHSRHLAHRALSPHAVYVRDPDGPKPSLVITDWQTGGLLPGATRLTTGGPSTDPASLELFFDDEIRRYQAPEATTATRPFGQDLDLFALGALTYRIFSGADPAGTPEELATAVRDSGLHLDAVADGMPYNLVELVYDATRGDPLHRLKGGLPEFRERVGRVWDELTAAEVEPEGVVDPLTAHRGDRLDGGLVVVERLGTGSTAVALSVTRDEGTEPLVLKVARDEQFAERFAAEARTLGGLKHPLVASLVEGPVVVGQRTALLLDSAGSRTLAEELRGGRLPLDSLERYGRDLLDIVNYLDAQGVWHRDIKPANLAIRPRRKDKQPHLCVFDFSLAATPVDQLQAGTAGYVDPFLGPPRRLRFDAAAERFAAAVVLYEMATGTLPKWGDDANPAAVSDEVNINPAAFDAEVGERLAGFFRKALARDSVARFDTVDDMTDAWRAIFQQVPKATSPESVPDQVGVPGRDDALEADLTARARSALERLGVHTIGDLLDTPPSRLTRAQGVPDATRKEILAYARAVKRRLAAVRDDSGPPRDPETVARGIEAVSATLLPSRRSKHLDTVAILLGQRPGPDGSFRRWPTQKEAAEATGSTQPQISVVLRGQVRMWLANAALDAVRDEIVALLDARGRVMAADEIAEALISTRGSYTADPKRLAQALGVVRAAVEAELSTGGDARVAIQRLRGCDTVLVGREPTDPAAATTAADLLGYVVRLGTRARDLAGADPLPLRQRAVEELRRVTPPAGVPALEERRLLQLAAAGSGGKVDVNALGQLYPIGMAAVRALRLTSGSLVGQTLTVDQVRDRVRARFPLAEELPLRPALTKLIDAADVPLIWHEPHRAYVSRDLPAAPTGTMLPSSHAPLLGRDAADEIQAKLAGVIARRGFIVVLAPFRRLRVARAELLARLGVTEVDVTDIMLERLRVLGFPWEAMLAADTGVPTDVDFRTLVDLVHQHVGPAVDAAMAAAPGPVLLTEAAPLARYGELRIIQELADPTRQRPAARLLLVPARRPEPAMLDDVQLPLTSPSSQAVWLAEAWLSRKAAVSG